MTVTGQVDSPAITNAAHEDAGRVGEDEGMAGTGSSAFMERKWCGSPGARPIYGRMRPRETNVFVDTSVFSILLTFGVSILF